MATTNIGDNIINLTDLSYALAHLTSNFNGKIQDQKDYTDSRVEDVLTDLVSAMHFKGGLAGTSSSPGAYTPSANIGDVYKVTTAGYINGIKVEVNDTLICTANVAQANSSNYTTVRNSWLIIQGNTDGVVIGPASATNNNIAVFDGTTGKLIKNSGYTIATSVPSGAVFTDTKVTQTATTTNATYELLFSNTANNDTLTEGARKTSTLTYNPSTKALVTGGTVNGYTLAAASAKGVDTSIAANSTSANLPTSQAVSDFANTTLADYARLDGASFTGPVNFGDSVSADDLTAGQLIVTGNASFTNNISANTINGVEVGSSPKFTDTITTVSVSGSGNAITAASASNGAVTLTKGITFKTAQTAVTAPTATTNEWVNTLEQNTNGDITVTYTALDTSGTWSGNAATATKWASAQTAYVTLGTASTTTTLQGGSSTAQTLGVDGTLGVGNGGTGKASWTQWGIVYASASDTLSQVTAGAAANSGYLLQSNGAAAPSWINATNTNAVNTIVKRDASGNFSAGTITATLNGNATTATTASKLGSSNIGSGINPMYLNGGVATASTNTVGAADRPVYLSSGTITQATYRMAGTNVTATSALSIDNNLDTGIWYVSGTSGIYSQSDGAAYVNKYSDSWIGEIYQDYRTGQIALRGKKSGTWQDWRKVLDSANYTDYTADINGADQTSSVSIYAPTAVGTSGQVLSSSGSGAPTWVDSSTVGSKIQIVRW